MKDYYNGNIKCCPNRKRFIIVTVCLLFIVWFLRYNMLNNYFEENFSCQITKYKVGDKVALGENIIVYDKAPGYYITVLDAKILSYDDFVESLPGGETINIEDAPDYVMDIKANIFNSGSKAEGIYLPDFLLHSYDMYTDSNFTLIAAANPVLEEGSFGISLAEETEFTVHLVFNLRKEHLSSKAYKNIEQYPFFLRVTSYPQRQEIVIQ